MEVTISENSFWVLTITAYNYAQNFIYYFSPNSIYLSGFFYSCSCLLVTKHHSSLFLHWSGSKFLVVKAACTPSIHVFLGRPLFLLSRGIQSVINLVLSPLASFWCGHTIVVFSSLWCLASLSLPLFPLYVYFLVFPSNYLHTNFPLAVIQASKFIVPFYSWNLWSQLGKRCNLLCLKTALYWW